MGNRLMLLKITKEERIILNLLKQMALGLIQVHKLGILIIRLILEVRRLNLLEEYLGFKLIHKIL
jgi:hypothetical protein